MPLSDILKEAGITSDEIISRLRGGDQQNSPVPTPDAQLLPPAPNVIPEGGFFSPQNIEDVKDMPDTTGVEAPNTEGMAESQPAEEEEEAPSKPEVSPDIAAKMSLLQRYKEAQQQKKDIELGNRFRQAGALIGGGISKQTPIDVTKLLRNADEPIQNLQQEMSIEKQDPQSEYSKGLRGLFKEQYGINLPEGLSGEDIAKSGTLGSIVEKKYASDQMNERALEQTRETAAMRRDIAAQRAEEARNKHSVQLEEKKSQLNTKRFDQMGKLLTAELASSRSAFGKAALSIRGAEGIEALTAGIDPNHLDNRQITEIARNLDAMLSSGQPTVSGMSKLIPSSWGGSAAKIEEYISNIPQGAQQGAFVQRMLDTVAREKELAAQQMKRTQGKTLGNFMDLKQEEPEKWSTMMKLHGLPEDVLEKPIEIGKKTQTSTLGSISKATLKDYADKHNVSEEEAKKLLTKAGYDVQ